MYGFQSDAARRMAQMPAPEPTRYADGGLVARMKSADAGPSTFGARGLSQLRDMIPQMQAMGFKQHPQQPQYLASGGLVRGPGTGTSDSIPDEAEPGTFIMPADSTAAIGPSALEKMGTVPVRLSDGEFKLPPEQVMALGTAVLKMMKDVTHTPVNGQDGGQTDEEVGEAQGFAPGAADRMAQMPEQLFADGGMVENDVTRVGNSYSGGNVGGNIGFNGQMGNGTVSTTSWTSPVPAPTPAPATTAPAPSAAAANPAPAAAPAPAAPMGWAERNAQRNLEVSASSIMDSPERRAAQAALAPPPPPAPAPAPAATAAPAAVGFQSAAQRLGTTPSLPKPQLGFQPRRYADGGTVSPLADLPPGYQPRGYFKGETVVDDREQQALANQTAMYVRGAQEAAANPPPAPAPAAAPSQPAGALTRAAGAGRGFSNPASATPSPAVEAMSSGLGFQPNAVTRTGNSYTGPANISGDVTINGGAPRNGGEITSQNMGAANGLARRSAVDAMANMPNAPAPVQAPTVRHSGNDWASRNALRNAEVSASSITNNGGRFDQTGGRNPAALAYRAALDTDNTLQASEPGLAAAAMKENSETNRSAMRDRSLAAQAQAAQRGEMDRTIIKEQGDNARTGLTTRAALDAARLKARDDNKAPAGYRFTANGNMEPIPGGPAASKVADDAKTRESGFDGSRQALGTINRLIASPGRKGATGGYNLNRFIPGNESADFAAEVETLKAQTFLPMIQQLRGMGALSNAEGDKINAAVGALNFNMSEPAFAESLGRIRDQLGSGLQRSGMDTKEIANWGLEAPTSAGEQSIKPAGAAPAPAAPATQRAVSRSGVIDGRRVVQYSDGSVEYAN